LSEGERACYPERMEYNRAGRVDLAVVASLLAAVAALAAVATAGLVAWEVREEARSAGVNARVEAFWHVTDRWNSPAMLDTRSAAATVLLAKKPPADVNAVLDFFDELVLLVKRGALDEELTALQFYWPLANYWAASSDYVRQVQREEPSAWKDIGGLVDRLGAIEARRKQQPLSAVRPSPDDVQQFLVDEQGENECTDESEAEKTPA
jgi:hypothetical protein